MLRTHLTPQGADAGGIPWAALLALVMQDTHVIRGRLFISDEHRSDSL